MANINLISEYRADRVRGRKIVRSLALVIVALSVVGFAGFGALAAQFLVVRARTVYVERELEKVRPVLAEIEAAERAREALKPRLATLRDAQSVTTRWHAILDGLKQAVPAETWLISVGVEPGGNDLQVLRLHGMTSNQTRVGETMYRLAQQADHYTRVDLRYTQTKPGVDVEGVEFELGAILADVDPDSSPTAASEPAGQERQERDGDTTSN